jgi:putative tributyrin esterase
MACFQGNIFSRSLSMETQLYVSLPQDGRRYLGNGRPKTLILLHGISDNASGWARRSQADYFADKYGIAIVMPEVQRSFYQDMRFGLKYYSYIAKELPDLIGDMFNISTKYEDMMVAGLSMGGYGALRVAFGNPERFSVCGAFSAACDITSAINNREFAKGVDIGYNLPNELVAMFGTDFVLPDDCDLYKLVAKVSKGTVKPRLYQACGTEDFTYQMNLDFAKVCRTLPLDFLFEEWAGLHDWDFWNVALEKMLQHFLGEPTIQAQGMNLKEFQK